MKASSWFFPKTPSLVQRGFHRWISYVFWYKWDKVCVFLLKWVAKLFDCRNKRLNVTGEPYLTRSRLLMVLGVRVWSELSFCCCFFFFTILASSGPVTIHLKRALGFPVIPIIPPSPLINSLFFSWAWSSGIDEKVLVVFCTVSFPPLKNSF